MKTTEVLLHTEGFVARAELSQLAVRKARKLFRHDDGIERVRLNVTRESLRGSQPRFTVLAVLERSCADAVVHATAAHPESAISEAFEKLERIVTARTTLRSHGRRHPHATELAATLPKVGAS